jgi:hypothetical protein
LTLGRALSKPEEVIGVVATFDVDQAVEVVTVVV